MYVSFFLLNSALLFLYTTTAFASQNSKNCFTQAKRVSGKSTCNGYSECGTIGVCMDRCYCFEQLGYNVNPTTGLCTEDVNECECGTDDCNEYATCYNIAPVNLTQEGFECICKPGYEFKNDSKNCFSINECLDDPCGNTAIHECIELEGDQYYRCVCASGYYWLGLNGNSTQCMNINECETGTACPPNSDCEDLPGSFRCTCHQGYFKEVSFCNDIDECATLSNPCSNHICINTNGSYDCECRTGYRKDNSSCVNVNECQENTFNCPDFSTCRDIEGSYECVCNDGFSLTTINETSECRCSYGYSLINETCVNVNECDGIQTVCPKAYICVDFDGYFECHCDKNATFSNCTDLELFLDRCENSEFTCKCDNEYLTSKNKCDGSKTKFFFKILSMEALAIAGITAFVVFAAVTTVGFCNYISRKSSKKFVV